MELFLKRRDGSVSAVGVYDEETGKLTVKKGSKVSTVIHESEKFKGASTIQKLREQYCSGDKTNQDVVFSSASTAANFVTGGSTNGLVAWRTESGEKLRNIIKK